MKNRYIKTRRKKSKFLFKAPSIKEKSEIMIIKLSRSFSNFFVSLADITHKYIIGKSAAYIIGKKEPRRRRKAPQTLLYILENLNSYLKYYNITDIIIFSSIRSRIYFEYMYRYYNPRNINILAIIIRRHLPFSFTRSRRARHY